MIYVPVVPPTHTPSPRTRELAGLLSRVIEEYEKHHPSLTGSEVREALHLAAQSSSRAGPVVAVLAGVAALAALAVGVLVFLSQNGSVSADAVPMTAVMVILFGIIAVAVLLKRMAGR